MGKGSRNTLIIARVIRGIPFPPATKTIRNDPGFAKCGGHLLQLRSDEGMASRMAGTPVADNAAMTGTDVATYIRERPGMSAFAFEDGVVYHTYSAYARGLDALSGMFQWLDRAPKGRNETSVWWRLHDEYEPLSQDAGSCCHGATAPP
jgi:hypothetical protein